LEADPTGSPAGTGGGHTRAVDVVAELAAPCPPAELYRWLEDLGHYPSWLEIVRRAVPIDPGEQSDLPGTAGAPPAPAWDVELRGRLGPLARSKRLRMVRTGHEPPRVVTFERREVDARSHSPWVLYAEVAEAPGGSVLTMRLHYGGGLWGPVLERMLGEEINRSRPRLLELVSGR
jgi:hypothetical protein